MILIDNHCACGDHDQTSSHSGNSEYAESPLMEDSTMGASITIRGQKARKGERMTGRRGWKLAATRGRKRIFTATLIDTINWGRTRLAIFSVPK